MIAIELFFPSGKYHATPWSSHVNEGQVEWPPSPWRILRALIATWHRKAHSEIPEEFMRRLMSKLASQLPIYALPADQLSLGHTRHYMPLYGTNERPSKIFDAFVSISNRGPAIVSWPDVVMDENEEQALGVLVDRLSYLGRAESWVEGTLLSQWNGKSNSLPFNIGDQMHSDEELVKLIAPIPEEDYRKWRAEFSESLGKVSGRKGFNLPKDMFSVLHMDTGDIRRTGWSSPPGSKFVLYRRPKLQNHISYELKYRKQILRVPTVARFALSSSAPPRLTKSVAIADRMRKALLSKSDALTVFAGKDESGKPLEGHVHAHIFCESNGGKRGEITHVTLYAPLGFDADAKRAIMSLEKLWGQRGHDIQLILLSTGQPEDFAGFDDKAGECPLFEKSRVWISRTPFVPTRLPKTNRNGRPRFGADELQLGSPEHDLRRLIKLAGFADPLSVDSISFTQLAGRKTPWLEFWTSRKNELPKVNRRGYGYRLTFPEPVSGPLAFGHGNHFGLGLFVPEV